MRPNASIHLDLSSLAVLLGGERELINNSEQSKNKSDSRVTTCVHCCKAACLRRGSLPSAGGLQRRGHHSASRASKMQAQAFILVAFAVCASGQRHPIRDALFLGNDTLAQGNVTAEDCVWRRERDSCPDPELSFNLYTANNFNKRVNGCPGAVHQGPVGHLDKTMRPNNGAT
ncbi:hypothetical protein EVAR_143_1 [Eumeta japonica]|uniref:Uncharacterized protein n=1 Tax=Eumeta variegata TaxID=151549 RepID=A0A4C1S8K8_EUMVA|nr:hypothetical protein EVAR_143_1 [Eumeta japonica]